MADKFLRGGVCIWSGDVTKGISKHNKQQLNDVFFLVVIKNTSQGRIKYIIQ